MTISFKPTDQPAPSPVFGDVKENQFFVTASGSLCQKIRAGLATIIAYPSGNLNADTLNLAPHEPIARILDHITHIDF